MGRRESRKGRVRGRKNKPKKAKFVCKKKNQERNVSTTQILFPSRKKSAPKKRLVCGGCRVPEWAEAVLRHIDLAGKDLACPSVC